jgi:glycosyltransferase involved in cell wall biosynthesis
MSDKLFIGVTTWNSELFLETCLRAIRSATNTIPFNLAVVDNLSTDRSVEIAQDYGASVHREYCSQAVALNRLLAMSKAKYTLLMHSDVVLLSSDWFLTCTNNLTGDCALVSPEDIGCGPLTRPYGAGKPESCFMFFETEKARNCYTWKWIRRRGIPWPIRHFDFDDYYITHDIPETLKRRGYSWKPMKVHASPADLETIYRPTFTPEYWSDALSRLRYAMGNFYSIDGVVTHYHNWFDRVPKNIPFESKDTTEGDGKGLPLAFLSLGTRNFLNDYDAGTLLLPNPEELMPTPKITRRNQPNMSLPYSEEISELGP